MTDPICQTNLKNSWIRLKHVTGGACGVADYDSAVGFPKFKIKVPIYGFGL